MKVQRDTTFRYKLLQQKNYTALRNLIRLNSSKIQKDSIPHRGKEFEASHFLRNSFYYTII